MKSVSSLVFAVAIIATTLTFTETRVYAGKSADAVVKTESVALFKNGLGYFTSSATLPTGASTIRINQLPIPSHGTFWVGYPEDLKVRALYTSIEEIKAEEPVSNIVDLLRSNIGKKVTIITNRQDMVPIKGTIIEVTQVERQPEAPNPYFMGEKPPNNNYKNQFETKPPLVIIRTSSGNTIINSGSIVQANFDEDEIAISAPSIVKLPSIRMELEKASSGQQIGLSYLANGITWVPSYLIDITDTKNAKLSAKAVVINEVNDLENIHLDLVTGYPNTRFGYVGSPVAMSQNLHSFLTDLASDKKGRYFTRGSTAYQLAYNMPITLSRGGPMSESEIGSGYPTQEEGTISEDLFLYPVDNFSLKCGETACIPLFTTEVPYEHIYTWKIPDDLDENERYQQANKKDDQPDFEEVWHSCRMTNNMKMPWTTAAAEFVKDGQFTGQDICYYTAPGAETTVRINRAMNVVAERSEIELSRERSAATFYGYHYDLVKVKGDLKIKNHQDKSVTVEVTKSLSGEVLDRAPEAKDTKTAKGLQRVNPRHELVWEFELSPGQEKNISYTYSVYIRN